MKTLIPLLVLTTILQGFSQKFTAESSLITFYSDAPLEAIKAQNVKAISILNLTTGDIVYSIPIQEFEFEKDLMKQHFNEKYMESDKFPKATFQGKITGYTIDVKGAQDATAKGKLTMHGVTKDVELKGTIDLSSGKPVIKSTFKVLIADYSIKIPQLLWKNIAEEVEVKVEFTYKPDVK